MMAMRPRLDIRRRRALIVQAGRGDSHGGEASQGLHEPHRHPGWAGRSDARRERLAGGDTPPASALSSASGAQGPGVDDPSDRGADGHGVRRRGRRPAAPDRRGLVDALHAPLPVGGPQGGAGLDRIAPGVLEGLGQPLPQRCHQFDFDLGEQGALRRAASAGSPSTAQRPGAGHHARCEGRA